MGMERALCCTMDDCGSGVGENFVRGEEGAEGVGGTERASECVRASR